MNKEIHYLGYSAVPSDYECQDGALSASLNLISEDDQIKPLTAPKEVMQLLAGERVLFIHNVPGQKNYIFGRDNSPMGIKAFWLKVGAVATSSDSATYIDAMDGFLGITAVGNTLIFALESGLHYVLWKDGAYISLGNRPPFVSIDFGMCQVGTLTNSGDFTIPACCHPAWNERRQGVGEKEDLAAMTQAVYGLLNPAIVDNITTQGLFYQPCFVRYAYRLYDGSHCWHSAPILMLPTVLPPTVKYIADGLDRTDGTGATEDATLTLDVPYFALYYRVIADGLSGLSQWADIVAGIDIYISAPIYTYDQSADLTWRPVTTKRNMLFSLSEGGSLDIEYRPGGTTGDGGTGTRPSSRASTSFFVGHYASSETAAYVDHYEAPAEGSVYIAKIKPHPKFHDNIRHAHDFYKVAEIDIKDLTGMSAMARLKLLDNDFSALVTKEPLTDDYQSHCRLVASSVYAFNGRLNLAGISVSPADPLPIRSVMQFSNDGQSNGGATLTVWTRINGTRCKAVHTGDGIADILYTPSSNFPRYIFYPDAQAYKMRIAIGTQTYTFNLTPHEFLNGAYYYSGNYLAGQTPPSVTAETANCATSVKVSSKIYTSEVNNPYFFPLLGINTVGSGDVYAICSAAKALSQGQFGQFPLYAFTSEGVWALETNSSGTYSARQPITRDVCINTASITQIDSAVLFATARGIMLLSGSQTQCITDSISSEYPFNVLTLPGMDTLHAKLSHDEDSDSCFPMAPFSKFLASCRMVYDYVHQHIIVYSPSYTYAYVYSLRSRQWGMMYSRIDTGVNSYPEALAVDKSGLLIDFSSGAGVIGAGLLVTRPLKLGAPDVHKTIDAIIQRGHFAKGKVQSVLYGSRDLSSWHLVWSSKNQYLRGFHGTPYKYYRIALYCDLAAGESIFSASVQFMERLTNQLR